MFSNRCCHRFDIEYQSYAWLSLLLSAAVSEIVLTRDGASAIPSTVQGWTPTPPYFESSVSATLRGTPRTSAYWPDCNMQACLDGVCRALPCKHREHRSVAKRASNDEGLRVSSQWHQHVTPGMCFGRGNRKRVQIGYTIQKIKILHIKMCKMYHNIKRGIYDRGCSNVKGD